MLQRIQPPISDSNEIAGLSTLNRMEKIEKMLQETCTALSNAWYLTRAAADEEPSPRHAAYLTVLSDDIKTLHEQTMVDLLDRARPTDETGTSVRR